MRLPTEAEWEFAARGRGAPEYPWGNEAPDAGGVCRANFRQGRTAVDGFEYTAPCGSFGPAAAAPRADGSSIFGALDMAGNVAEWCADYYARDTYRTCPANAPRGPERGSERVLRGGCFSFDARGLRSAYRGDNPAFRDLQLVGFRVAR